MVEDSATSDSAYSARLSVFAAASSASIYQDISLPPGRKVRVRFKYMSMNSTSNMGFRITDAGVNVYLNSSSLWQAGASTLSVPDSVGAWDEYELTFVTHDSYSEYRFLIAEADNGAVDYIDNFEAIRMRKERP